MVMKKVILVLWVIVLSGMPVSLVAQNKAGAETQEQRKAKYEQFCQFRRDYMKEQMKLTEQEAKQFFPLYE